MKPIFLVLCLASGAMMAYTFYLGLSFHSGKEALDLRRERGEAVAPSDEEAVGGLLPSHFIWGMMTGIAVSLAHSVALTYFVGTGKAIKEQTELQGWGPEDYQQWKKNMADAVIPTSVGILLIIAAAFSGGFTMITALSPEGHLVIAGLGIFGQLPIFMRVWFVIGRNGRLMDEIVARLDQDGVIMTL